MTMNKFLLVEHTCSDVQWKMRCIANCLKYRSLILKPIRTLPHPKPATPHVIPLQNPVKGKQAPQYLCIATSVEQGTWRTMPKDEFFHALLLMLRLTQFVLEKNLRIWSPLDPMRVLVCECVSQETLATTEAVISPSCSSESYARVMSFASCFEHSLRAFSINPSSTSTRFSPISIATSRSFSPSELSLSAILGDANCAADSALSFCWSPKVRFTYLRSDITVVRVT